MPTTQHRGTVGDLPISLLVLSTDLQAREFVVLVRNGTNIWAIRRTLDPLNEADDPGKSVPVEQVVLLPRIWNGVAYDPERASEIEAELTRGDDGLWRVRVVQTPRAGNNPQRVTEFTQVKDAWSFGPEKSGDVR